MPAGPELHAWFSRVTSCTIEENVIPISVSTRVYTRIEGGKPCQENICSKKKCGGEIKGWKLEFLSFPSHDDYRERRGGAERISPPLRSCTLLLAVRLSCPVQSEPAADDQILVRAKQSTCTRQNQAQ